MALPTKPHHFVTKKTLLMMILFIAVIIIAFIGNWYVLTKTSMKLQNSSTNPIACTQEAKLCSDGSYVSRTGPHCEFSDCPGE